MARKRAKRKHPPSPGLEIPSSQHEARDIKEPVRDVQLCPAATSTTAASAAVSSSECNKGVNEYINEAIYNCGGLKKHEVRRVAWRMFLGLPESCTTTFPPEDVEHCARHLSEREVHQVDLDVARAFTFWDIHKDLSDNEKATKQKTLRWIVLYFLYKHRTRLSYCQGVHDVCSVFLEVLGTPLSFYVSERFFLFHGVDLLSAPFSHSVLPTLSLIRDVVGCMDTRLGEVLRKQEIPLQLAVPWVVTCFSHVLPFFDDAARVLDAVLASEPSFIVFLSAHIILSQRIKLLRILSPKSHSSSSTSLTTTTTATPSSSAITRLLSLKRWVFNNWTFAGASEIGDTADDDDENHLAFLGEIHQMFQNIDWRRHVDLDNMIVKSRDAMIDHYKYFERQLLPRYSPMSPLQDIDHHFKLLTGEVIKYLKYIWRYWKSRTNEKMRHHRGRHHHPHHRKGRLFFNFRNPEVKRLSFAPFSAFLDTSQSFPWRQTLPAIVNVPLLPFTHGVPHDEGTSPATMYGADAEDDGRVGTVAGNRDERHQQGHHEHHYIVITPPVYQWAAGCHEPPYISSCKSLALRYTLITFKWFIAPAAISILLSLLLTNKTLLSSLIPSLLVIISPSSSSSSS